MARRILIFVLPLLFAMCKVEALAQEVHKVGDLYYEVQDDGTAAVCSSPDNSYSGDVVIPSTVEIDGVECRVTAIKKVAFQRSSITSVLVPESVTSIGYRAIADCPTIASAILPADAQFNGGKEGADGGVFEYSYKLSSVKLVGTDAPSDVRINQLFARGATIQLVDDYTSTTGQVLQGVDGNFVFRRNDTGLSITGMAHDANGEWLPVPADLVIPSQATLGGYTAAVTKVCRAAFADNKTLVNVTIPASVTSFEEWTFSSCDNITTVTLPVGTQYYSTIFNGCPKLTTIKFVGDQIPSDDEFRKLGHGNATILLVDDYTSTTGTVLRGEDGDFVYRRNDAGGLTIVGMANDPAKGYKKAVPANLVVPAQATLAGQQMAVTAVGQEAFAYSSTLATVVVPESVTSIGGWAFVSSQNLIAATLPAGATYEWDVLGSCGKLATVKLVGTEAPDDDQIRQLNAGNATILLVADKDATTGKVLQGTIDGFRVRANDTGLTIVGLTNNVDAANLFPAQLTVQGSQLPVTQLGYDLNKPDNLTVSSITVPSSVTSVADRALENFSSVDKVTLPATLKIGNYSNLFGWNSSSVTLLTVLGERLPSAEWLSRMGADNIRNVVRVAQEGASQGDIYRGTDDDGFSYRLIDGDLLVTAYSGKETEVTIPAQATIATVTAPVKGVQEGTFQDNTDITAITFAEGITKIGDYCCQGCSSLSGVELPGTLTSIGEQAFKNAGLSEPLTVPASVKSIGRNAFAGCSSLPEVTLYAATDLRNGTFNDCYALRTIKIIGDDWPAWVDQLPGDADITLYATPGAATGKPYRPVANGVRYQTLNDGSLQVVGYTSEVPAELTLAPTVVIGGQTYNVSGVGTYAFSYCDRLTKVTITMPLEAVPQYCFYSCSNLADVTLPASVTSVGDYAFYHTALSSIALPDAIEKVGGNAFGYTKITAVTLPSRVRFEGTSFGDEVAQVRFNGLSEPTNWTSLPTMCDVTLYDDASATQGRTLRAVVGDRAYDVTDGGLRLAGVKGEAKKTLTTIDLASEVTYNNVSLGPVAIVGRSALQVAALAGNLTLPKTITKIDAYAFAQTKISTATLYASTAVDYGAFNDCPNLTLIKVIGTRLPDWTSSLPRTVTVKLCASESDEGEEKIGTFTVDGAIYRIERGDAATSVTLVGYDDPKPAGTLVLPADVVYQGTTYSVGYDDNLIGGCPDVTDLVVPANRWLYYPIRQIQTVTYIADAQPGLTPIVAEASYWATSATADKTLFETTDDNDFRYHLYGDVWTLVECSGYMGDDNLTLGGSTKTPYGVIDVQDIAAVPQDVWQLTLDAKSISFSQVYSRAMYLTLTDKVEKVADQAFGQFVDCYELRAYASLADLDYNRVFNQWSDLRYLNITGDEYPVWEATYPDRVQRRLIGGGQQQGQEVTVEGLTYRLLANGQATVTGRDDQKLGRTVVIPESVESDGKSYTVTSIGQSAFSGALMTAVQLPSTITSIGEYAFGWCSYLSSINFPEGLTTVGLKAFDGNGKLTSVTLPSTVTSVGNGAFSYTSSLTLLKIPAAAQVGSQGDCPKLTELSLYGTAVNSQSNFTGGAYDVKLYATPDAREGAWVVFTVDGKRYQVSGDQATLISSTNQSDPFVVPATVEKEGKTYRVTNATTNAFSQLPMGNVVRIVASELPAWTDNIPGNLIVELAATPDATQATPANLTVGGLRYKLLDAATVQLVGYDGKKPAGKLTVPASITVAGKGYSVVSMADEALRNCDELTEVVLPQTIQAIIGNAFNGCQALRKVTMPATATANFYGCQHVSFRLIGDEAPDNWTNLQSYADDIILYPTAEATAGTPLFFVDGNLKYLFDERRGLSVAGYVKQPQGKLAIPAKATCRGTQYTVKAVANNAFSYCSNLTALEMAEGIETISWYAFYNCYNIASVKLPGTLKAIEDNAFASTGITSVDLPKSLTAVGGDIFYGCRELNTVRLAADSPLLEGDLGRSLGTDYVRNVDLIGAQAPADLQSIPSNVTTVMLYPDATLTNGKPLRLVRGAFSYALDGDDALTLVACVAQPASSLTIGEPITLAGKQYSVDALGKSAFSNYSYDVTDVTLTDNVLALGADALPQGVRQLSLSASAKPDKWAFNSLYNLQRVTLRGAAAPDWWTTLPNSGDIALLKPDGSTEDLQFTEGDFRYRVGAQGLTIVGYSGESNGTTIPLTVMHGGKQLNVVGIGNGQNVFPWIMSVTIPEGITQIGAYAFQNAGLAEVTLPKSVKSVGINAFNDCGNLKLIKIVGNKMPDYVTNLPSNCAIMLVGNATDTEGELSQFVADGLVWKLDGDRANVVGVNEVDGEGAVTVPDKVTHQGKTYQLGSVDINSYSVKKLLFDDDITELKGEVGCNNLQEVHLPDKLVALGDDFFSRGNYHLTKIVVPKSVKTLGARSLSPSNLSSVTLYADLETVGSGVFSSAQNVTVRIVGEEWPAWMDQMCRAYPNYRFILVASETANSGVNAQFAAAGAEGDLQMMHTRDGALVKGLSNYRGDTYVLPTSVTDAEGHTQPVVGVMSDANFGDVTTIKIVGTAFPAWVDQLPKNLTVMLVSSADDDEGETIEPTTPAETSFTEGDVNYQLQDDGTLTATGVADNLLTEVTVPGQVAHNGKTYSVASVGQNFLVYGISHVRSVTIGEGVKSLESNAFSNASNLRRLSLPASLESIGNYAFEETGLTELVIPDGVKTVARGVFSNNYKLQRLTVNSSTPLDLSSSSPSTLATIVVRGAAPTAEWLSLMPLTCGIERADGTPLQVLADNGLTYRLDGNKATVAGYHGVKPAGTLTIEGPVTLGGKSYELAAIDADLTACDLAEVRIVNATMPTVKAGILPVGCKLTWVTDASQTQADELSFEQDDCTYQLVAEGQVALMDIDRQLTGAYTPPTSVVRGGKTYQVTTLAPGLLGSFDKLTSVAVPQGITTVDGAFKNNQSLTAVTLPASVNGIGEGTFSGCSNLAAMAIPEGVTTIGPSAFSGCSSLATLTLPEGLTSIGTDAFRGCSSLAAVTLPASVTSIGTSAFSGCSSLATLTIPDGVTAIGQNAFYGCHDLTKLTLPSTAVIADGAFYGCSGLTDVVVRGPRGTDLTPYKTLFGAAVNVTLEATSALTVTPYEPKARPVDNTLYDLSGRPVKGTPQPGIYIRNGKLLRLK